jgi:hypothetical protein
VIDEPAKCTRVDEWSLSANERILTLQLLWRHADTARKQAPAASVARRLPSSRGTLVPAPDAPIRAVVVYGRAAHVGKKERQGTNAGVGS